MPYQSVSGTPRFYIDLISYLSNLALHSFHQLPMSVEFENYAGLIYNPEEITIDNEFSLIGLNPALRTQITPLDRNATEVSFSIGFYEKLAPWFDLQNQNNFISVLGHNLASRINDVNGQGLDMFVTSWVNSYEEVFNAETIISGEEEGMRPLYDNASIFKFIHTNVDIVHEGRIPSFLVDLKFKTRDGHAIGQDPFYIGSVSCGRFFDMPHSPEYSLTMTHDYSGSNKFRAVGGEDYSNSNWDSPPKWGTLSPWELPSPTGLWFGGGLYDFEWRYSGRRIWEMEFNQIKDVDIEPVNLGGVGTEGERSSNWFQDVIRMTMGGALPFVFCPDPQVTWFDGGAGTDNFVTPPRGSQFAICRFDMKTFEKEQVANGVYNIKIKIIECW